MPFSAANFNSEFVRLQSGLCFEPVSILHVSDGLFPETDFFLQRLNSLSFSFAEPGTKVIKFRHTNRTQYEGTDISSISLEAQVFFISENQVLFLKDPILSHFSCFLGVSRYHFSTLGIENYIKVEFSWELMAHQTKFEDQNDL